MLQIQPNLTSTQLYNRLKLDLADQLRIVHESLAALGFQNKQKAVGDLMLKLAEDRFVLTVLGQFKRGKSTLLNAIAGREIFPTGVLPITSAITKLRYGELERIIIDRENALLPEEKPLSMLPQYVTETENPGNIKRVKVVNVEIPMPFLKNGFELVDTPGVGSATLANTETTYSYLPECDAVIFVISGEAPMTESEVNFIADIHDYTKRIFFVVNKIDLLTSQELNETLNYVEKKIREVTGIISPVIFPLSAQEGLQSRLTNNQTTYKQSGLQKFEEELASFLSNEKMLDFIGILCKKTLLMISDLCESQLKIDNGEVFTDEKSIDALSALNKAYKKIKLMHSSLSTNPNIDINQAVNSKRSAPENINTYGTEISIDFDLTPKAQGCPVCQHIAKVSSLFFAKWQYKLATSEDAQLHFAEDLGFCPAHTWQLVSITSTRGASIGFNKLAKAFELKLDDKKMDLENGNYIRNLIHDSKTCTVCKLVSHHESDYITKLAKELNQKEFWEKYNESQGVCLKHLGMLLDADLDQKTRALLVTHTMLHFTADAEDMRYYALKSDALLKQQLSNREKEAYLRTITRIAGGRDTVTPWNLD